MPKPFISICIPAYKRIDFLRRLMDSLIIQSFRDFEVIVTDDSPGDDVKILVDSYSELPVRYFRNERPLGTPENWNEGIRKASGQWIKLMHDDDWFSGAKSLAVFAEVAKKSKDRFIFSAYTNFFLERDSLERVSPTSIRMKALVKNPATLLSKNIIGPPSVTLHRNDGKFFYDANIKWVVDIDFYIRRLSQEKLQFIPSNLINVGMSNEQVTVDCVLNRKVQLPENFYLLQKIGTQNLRNILVYDAWWRLFRNLEVRSVDEIREAGYQGPIHPVLLSMIARQAWYRKGTLTIGLFSKTLMMAHYLQARNRIN